MKKLRLVKTTIYVKYDEFNELEGTDFNGLQLALKILFQRTVKEKIAFQ